MAKTNAQLKTDSANNILNKTYSPKRADTMNQDLLDNLANIEGAAVTNMTTATTPSASDATTKVANMAAVQAAVAAGISNVSPASKLFMSQNFI